MSNVVDFLERLGNDVLLRDAPQEEIELALAEAQIGAPMSLAILNKDAPALRILLNRVPLIGYQVPPDEEEQDEEEEGQNNPDKKKQPQDARCSSVISMFSCS